MSDSRGAAWKLERQLLEASTIGSVLERLVDCAGRLDAAVDVVTIALADSQHEIRGLLAERRRLAVTTDQLVFVDTVHALAPSLSSARDSYFGAYARSDHQLLFPGHEGLAAVGFAPLVRQNRLIASLNIASHSPSGLEGIKATGALGRLAVMAALAIDNALGAARLVRSGFVDVLTGWHNQHYLERRLEDELARSERDQRVLACALIDVDDFRLLNARYGNRAGDAVLQEVSQRIETIMRRSDVAARYGSEEFVLLLPNTEQHRGRPLVERIQGAVAARPIELATAVEVPVTVSVGIAEHQPGRQPADLKLAGSELLARAQLALYESQALRSRGNPGQRSGVNFAYTRESRESRPQLRPSYTMDWIDSEGYRANVGIILTDGQGRVLIGGRVGRAGWQFPQGGIAPNESTEAAMFRELNEEVGFEPEHVETLGCTRDWLRYRLPERFIRREKHPVCIGQKQCWYLLRLLADPDDARFDTTDAPEFDRCRWVDYWRPVKEVIYFKRQVYVAALTELGPLAFPEQGPPPRPAWWPHRWQLVTGFE